MSFVCLKDFENYAHIILPRNSLDYYRSGAGNQETLVQNQKAFSRLKLRPRFLRNVSNRNSSTIILGEKIAFPVGISPTAMQKMAHPQGECANARAVQAMGTIFILSTLSTSSIEEVAKAAPYCIKWFQLYIYKNRDITRSLVDRAEKAGYKALVLTVDTPFFGLRINDMRNKFALPPHLRLGNFEGDNATKINETVDGSGLNKYVNELFDSSLQWEDVKWLKSITKLPIILKGILTAEDALLAADLGVSGILVSNHGGRQIDGTPASIEALPEIVKSVGNKLEVYLDGGVNRGTDVFKALALGARMVFLGRPAVWGLAHSGEEGVKNILNIIKNEFDVTLALTGCGSVDDISSSMVVHKSHYAKL